MSKNFDISNSNASDYINKKIEKEKNKEKVIEQAYQQEKIDPIVFSESQEQPKPQAPIQEQAQPIQEEPKIQAKEEKEPTRQFAVYIPISLFNKFRVYSEIKGISQKKILVDALKEYMDKIDDNYIKEELLKKRPF